MSFILNELTADCSVEFYFVVIVVVFSSLGCFPFSFQSMQHISGHAGLSHEKGGVVSSRHSKRHE